MKSALISVIVASVAIGAAGLGGAAARPARRQAGAASPEPRPSGLHGLLHAEPATVKARLGEPSLARAEGRGAFWTYRGDSCALFIFFRDDGGLKVSGAAAGPRRHGVAPPELEACLRELEERAGADRPRPAPGAVGR